MDYMRKRFFLSVGKGNYFSFFWLSMIILFFFLLQVLFSQFTEFFLLNQRAIYGEYYRFITAIFLHGSITHLMYNLFALLLFGFMLESIIGTRNFLLVFFGSGILANIVSVFFYSSSLGASGAIYGILGCLTIMRPLMIIWAFGLIMPMFIATILWVIGDLIGLFIPSNTGHVAHLSGIIIGILTGFLLRKKYSVKKRRKTDVFINEDYINRWEDSFLR
jgi:membrane associated rhomboid family serine protease